MGERTNVIEDVLLRSIKTARPRPSLWQRIVRVIRKKVG